MKEFTKTIEFGDHTITLSTGKVARQATGSVMVTMGHTTILATVVGKKEARPDASFFPLTVNYIEKYYAGGRIPGGFLKREGRPTEHETLTSRLIDRPIRPLFPKGFMNEVQVITTVLSLDPEVSADIPAMVGASAALAISGIPFEGPIGAARVGYKDGIYLLNPSREHLTDSQLNLVVAGTEDAVLMVESEAEELSEQVMLGAVLFGHTKMQPVIKAINELASEAGKPRWEWTAPEENTALMDQVKQAAEQSVRDAYQIKDKQERYTKLGEMREQVVTQLAAEEETGPSADEVSGAFGQLEKDIVRGQVLAGQARIDGRDTKTVRPITIEAGMLPRTHGSALFTRGETQAIVTVTLGSGRDAQIIDDIRGDRRDPLMLHYNFPPYCVGEAGMMLGPKRREIGHGRLARRALEAVIPSEEKFPYVMRIVSEITESNGSSSMATVCGASLAMMDAGVEVKAPVAGIAMGLVKEGDNYVVLSDILGDEDHLGDMDFKVAGTDTGITALQMDIKITGINQEIMETALEQAKEGRLHILGEMNKALHKTREEVSAYAPRITTIKIHPDKIRDVIGKGGATIKALTEETQTTIDISDDGQVQIFATDKAAGDAAIQRIKDITADVEIGKIYDGKVVKIVDFGAFVSVLPGKEGLVHISQIADRRIEKVTDELSEGQDVQVKVIDIDRQGRVKLSMKEVTES